MIRNLEIEAEILKILLEDGPQSGATLTEKLPHISDIAVWRACYGSGEIRVNNCARYYLRYDILRGNQLRLSPSILRDFLTFSLVYHTEQMVEIVEMGTILANNFRSISLQKLSLSLIHI